MHHRPAYQTPSPYAIRAEYEDYLRHYRHYRHYRHAAAHARTLASAAEAQPWLAAHAARYHAKAEAFLATLTGLAARCTAVPEDTAP